MVISKEESNLFLLFNSGFMNGRRQGYGKKVIPGVGAYEGNWVNDNMDGKGTFTYDNGDFYDG